MKRQIILDIGSSVAHHNDFNIIGKTIDSVARLQDKTDKYQFIIKVQMWDRRNERISKQLESTAWPVFVYGYEHCAKKDISFTTSVFDKKTLDDVLCCYKVPFIKFACREWLYDLIPDSDKIKSYVSVSNWNYYRHMKENGHQPLICVPKYPATPTDYIFLLEGADDADILDPWADAISDHTCDWSIFNRYQPMIYECHFSIDKSMINDPVGGTDFVREPKDIEAIL